MHTHLLEVLKDVIDDELLGLIGVHPSKWVQIDHGIFKANKWESQGAFQGLVREKKGTDFRHKVVFWGAIILEPMTNDESWINV